MPILFRCSCGKQLRTKDENAGKHLKCPACGDPVPVPSMQAEPPAQATSTALRRRVADDRDGDDDEADEELAARLTRRSSPPKRLGDDAVVRMLLPVGRSVWAILSGYLGLFSVMLFPAPLALLTGLAAIWDMRRNPHRHGMGRAVFGIVMGTIGTTGLIILLVLFGPPGLGHNTAGTQLRPQIALR